MEYKVISFYKYTEIKNPENLKEELRSLCMQLNILGRILLGTEGLNGAVSGKKENLKKFRDFLRQLPSFSTLTFREQEIEEHAYHKLIVRVRKEICAFGENVNLKNKGTYLKPSEL